ncbi:flagellar hook-associated protein FlgK [Cellulomonas bogoriensis]|uniref:Flagellar hook-associated protein 1 n=1 Tax=Cellulomonas bogoriensis 69B4 = DSM 16987 TaxID=1386082 RepID=A0A0A0BYL6_9CELL|nr:flagellar hook-associated protein FlgK [Cellulomonas bogoriensis]KGM13065.1 flagellar hook protein FlgK [Cellulomonas bogoriensis 69B4 = DSM 16987]
MSTFSGLSMALSSMIAQRQALEVTGQNISNANTRGYTRQRADMAAVQALTAPSMHSAGMNAGNGVRVSNINRLGDAFLDARLRTETSGAAFQAAQAKALNRLEQTLTEPADTSVSAQLATFWAGWQDVANNPGDPAARNVLLGDAQALLSQISGGYRAVETQWSQLRTETTALVDEVNTTAAAVAQLNEQIRAISVSGDSPNELMDRRDQLVTTLAGLVGATARERDDGTVDVMVAGNALVRGTSAKPIAVSGSMLMNEAVAEPPSGNQVRLVWAESTGTPLTPEGGTLASHVSTLGPGGLLSGAAQAWNDLATSVHDTVNAVHVQGTGLDGTDGRTFFTAGPGPAATSLTLTSTDPNHVAAAAAGQGGLDGSIADAMSQLGAAPGGPDSTWRAFVVDIGVRTRAAEQTSTVAQAGLATAQTLQMSAASVDLDEEAINMLAYQRAYEGAARVLTVMDQMLDVLINRTGVVGR